MDRKFLIVSLSCLALFVLAGCAPTTQKTSTSSTVVSSTNDPDGDGDTKGVNHFPLTREATGSTTFIFDPKFGAFAVYDENGNRVDTGRASGGASFCPDIGRPCKTIVGRYKIFSKGDGNCISHTFPIETEGGAPMPYCMHFAKNYAIHGSYDVPDYNASHGCIRVSPTVAAWLSNNVMRVGTTVIILPY